MNGYRKKVIDSSFEVNTTLENAWDQITNVEIGHFRFPWYFRLMNIPKPVRAEITHEGTGGNRIAYFDNGKRFIQEIASWEKYRTYSFTFNPEDGFRAGYFFDLFKGVFRIVKGSYYITENNGSIRIRLKTDYAIRTGYHWLLACPVRIVLTVFQGYLLKTIHANVNSRPSMR